MRRAFSLLFAFTLLFVASLLLTAWTLEDCVEVNFDHPDCDRYVTTTTGQVTTTTVTQPEVTTTTFTDQTTTTTIGETPTTVPPTTTTIQECAPGLIHVPPFCLEPTTTAPPVPDTTAVVGPPEELPFTGIADLPLLALSIVGLSVLGFTALKFGRRAE